ncbi:uncharacterized protein LOC123670654 [Harmonia axyridis]|uniref:uncharacterized protein LOC123670654 n=1 Tax=Harmonia axyridis TaxID=115357 RepID=UPI001E274FC6|nr:uncharacterized protein LOC123670654 [Harmonia axyridis]
MEVLKKRSRSTNYTSREKFLLLTLITKSKHIIENKKTNSITWRDKEAAWKKICVEFNAQTPEGIPRKKESLKKFYENIKKTKRKERANGKMELFKIEEKKSQLISDPAHDSELFQLEMEMEMKNSKAAQDVELFQLEIEMKKSKAAQDSELFQLEMEIEKSKAAQDTELFQLEMEIKKSKAELLLLKKNNLLLDNSIKSLQLQLLKKDLEKS